jgi:uncharacterized membrane protein
MKSEIEGLGDSLFAFAITLLILGIALPAFKSAPSDKELTHGRMAERVDGCGGAH